MEGSRMNEADWWAATDPVPLIDWLFFDVLASERKMRLFACACCRRLERLTSGTVFEEILNLTEAFAEGKATEVALTEAHRSGIRSHEENWRGILDISPQAEACAAILCAADDAGGMGWRLHRNREWYRSEDNYPCPWWAAYHAAEAENNDASGHNFGAGRSAALHHVAFLRELFGLLPFREVGVEPGWLTPDVMSLVRGIDAEKAFDRMPILADALQDVGCANDDILTHCRREPGEHVRGCWVVDLLLGRPWQEPSLRTG